jgi:hypothetical protein
VDSYLSVHQLLLELLNGTLIFLLGLTLGAEALLQLLKLLRFGLQFALQLVDLLKREQR